MLGDQARDYPSLVRRELAEGHAVGGHTQTHSDLTAEDFEAATRDITSGFLPVASAGGQPNLFRFPQLKSSPELLTWLSEHGIAAVGADIDPSDWAGDPPQQTLNRIKRQLKARGRGIILMHDDQPNTVKLLPDLLAFLRA